MSAPIYPVWLRDRLESLDANPWNGKVWRHTFGDMLPTRENSRGARWNPAGTPAIYTSLERSTAIAEGDYAASVQPRAVTAARFLYVLNVSLQRVLDLSDESLLAELGINLNVLRADDHTPCRQVGGAVGWLENDGMLVPSARSEGLNLVIFTVNCQPDFLEVGPAEKL